MSETIQRAGARGAGRPVALAALALLAAIGVARIHAVSGLLPYSQHVDETFFTASVVKMVREGDANPRFFRYPSLPLYLATAAMLVSAPFGDEALSDVRTTRIGAPYATPLLFAAPRVLFALLSVAALGLLAFVGWRLAGAVGALAPPLLLSLSAVYQTSATKYLNVDVVAVFFVAATLAVVFGRWDDPRCWSKAIAPGLLAGMAVASKYNSGLILVPCALAICFSSSVGRGASDSPGADRLRKLVALGLVSAATFFVAVPYSLIDAGFFVEQVLFEIERYRTAPGFGSPEPGLEQLGFYAAALTRGFGAPLMVLAVVGAVDGLRRDRARALTLLSLPVLMLLHMSTNRLNFLRTVLPVFAVVALLQAIGIRAVLGWASAAQRALRAGARGGALVRPLALGAAGAALLVAAVFTAPWSHVLDRNVAQDPRNVVASWLDAHRDAGTEVLVAADIGLDPRRTEALGARPLAPDLADLSHRLDRGDGGEVLVVVPAYRPAHRYTDEAGPTVRALRARRAGAAREAVASLEARPGSRLVFEVAGSEIEVSLSPGVPAATVERPRLRVFAVGRGAGG